MKYLDPKATAESGDVDYEYHHIIRVYTPPVHRGT